jgi:hypothetical protein
VRSYLKKKKNFKKRTSVVAQGVGPEFVKKQKSTTHTHTQTKLLPSRNMPTDKHRLKMKEWKKDILSKQNLETSKSN